MRNLLDFDELLIGEGAKVVPESQIRLAHKTVAFSNLATLIAIS